MERDRLAVLSFGHIDPAVARLSWQRMSIEQRQEVVRAMRRTVDFARELAMALIE